MVENTTIEDLKTKHRLCSVEGCNDVIYALGYCNRHYNQIRKYGYILCVKNLRKLINKNDKCCYCGEKNNGKKNLRIVKKKIYCIKHAHHIERYGYIKKFTTFSPNIFLNKKKYFEVILRDINSKDIHNAIFDLNALKFLKKHKWANQFDGYNNYAVTQIFYKGKRRSLRMHRFILNNFKINDALFNRSFQCDHINRDTLDNRKINLRSCSQSINSFNRNLLKNNKSGYTGIRWDNERKKWASNITFGRLIHLGRFSNIQDAIEARRKAELKYFGEYLND